MLPLFLGVAQHGDAERTGPGMPPQLTTIDLPQTGREALCHVYGRFIGPVAMILRYRIQRHTIPAATLLMLAACASPPAISSKTEPPVGPSAPTVPPPVESPTPRIQNISESPEIDSLRSAIARYEQIVASGVWPLVPSTESLRNGDSDALVPILRGRLVAEGDLTTPSNSTLFDSELHGALIRFQHRHGLKEDGILGRRTIAALNISATERIDTLRHNLNRQLRETRRWGNRYIVVNTASATYRLVDNGETIFERPVIVGRPNWQTPRLDGTIDRIVLNPTWSVPPRIAQLELMPRIRREPGYLQAHHMRLVDGLIQQAPGPDNPLGRFKFVFPNDESIYLHDTSAPSLFSQDERHLSHGCVRLSNAEELAIYLLRLQPGWDETALGAATATGKTNTVRLVVPIPVHLVYDTAWVEPDGTVHFREDVYHRDIGS